MITPGTTDGIAGTTRGAVLNAFHKIRRIHLVGIGGAGMSGIAEVLHELGFVISGSDLRSSAVTAHLAALGIPVFEGHTAENIGDAEVVVYSSAVQMDNPELAAAGERNIPVIERSEMLGELTRLGFCVGIAGTHGKTTTTSMTGHILKCANMDPTIIVGGRAQSLGTGGILGSGRLLVVEADEYARTFLKMFPTLAVVTTLELEHLDIYADMQDLTSAFAGYLSRVPFYGRAILSADDEQVCGLMPHLTRPLTTFGLSPDADVRAADVEYSGFTSSFTLVWGGESLGRISLQVPGDYNVRNALAAAAVALELDVSFDDIQNGLNTFSGVDRRFQICGKVDGVTVVDDYAHHPTELCSALRAARGGWKNGRIHCVFQPHLYSRTQQFQKEFAEALMLADSAVLMDIYAAREKPIDGVTSGLIIEHGRWLGHQNMYAVHESTEAVDWLRKNARTGDLVITVGAGDVWKVGKAFLADASNG